VNFGAVPFLNPKENYLPFHMVSEENLAGGYFVLFLLFLTKSNKK